MATSFPKYPSTTFVEATDLAVFASNQLYDFVNGDINTEIETEEGGLIPSVAKALNEAATYKASIPWNNGDVQTDLMQPRDFNGTVYVPRIVPVTLGAFPTTGVGGEWRAPSYLNISNFSQVYNNVANMKADTTLTIGRKVHTLGYYTPGDGGGNDYEIVAAGTGTDDGGSFIDLTGVSGQAKGLFINGVHVKHFGAIVDNVANDTTPIINAIAYAYSIGGMEVLIDGLSKISSTIVIPQRVILKGALPFFANQFTNNESRPGGAGLVAATGMNADLVAIKLSVYNDAGTLREVGNDKKLVDYRHFGGIENLILFGTRSLTANPPSVTDLNTSGSGVVMQGVRYPVVKNVVSMYCAEKGVESESFDYGLGAISCNNLQLDRVTALSNASTGFSLSGGDSICSELIAGYNGGSGFSLNMGRTMIEFSSWNNKQDGIFITGSEHSIFKGHAYDNDRGGWRISATKSVTATGRSSANGRDAAYASTDRVGVLSSADNLDLALDVVDDGSYLGVKYQEYGFRILNVVNKVNMISSASTGNNVANWLVTDPAAINLHGSLTRGGNHPGFTLQDKIKSNGKDIVEVGGFGFNVWSSASVASGSINVGRNTLVSLNEGSPVNVTDIVSSLEALPKVTFRISGGSAVTFKHDSAKLRINGLADRVLSTGESISFIFVSGTVWQEV